MLDAVTPERGEFAVFNVRASLSLVSFAPAFAIAQGKVKGAIKDAANPHLKSKYADLASTWDACREALSDQGISVLQFPSRADGEVVVTTFLLHKSGEWMASSLALPVLQNTAQAIGSAITYGRRYGLAASVGVAPEEDDGSAAVGSHAQQQQPYRPPQQQPPPQQAAQPPPQQEVKRSGNPMSQTPNFDPTQTTHMTWLRSVLDREGLLNHLDAAKALMTGKARTSITDVLAHIKSQNQAIDSAFSN